MFKIIKLFFIQIIWAQIPGGARMAPGSGARAVSRMGGYGPRMQPGTGHGHGHGQNFRSRNFNLKMAGNTNGDPNWSVAAAGAPNTVDNFGGIHQGQLCGKILQFSLLPGKSQKLKSPGYPYSFGAQVQCVWSMEAPVGQRIRVDFDIFNLGITGGGCMNAYLEFSEPAFDLNGNPKVNLGGGSFKLCGKNPGHIITAGNALMITLHADESERPNQKFLLKMSTTAEAPRVIGNNGHPVTDGGVQNLRKTGQIATLPVKKSSVGSYGYPGSRPGPSFPVGPSVGTSSSVGTSGSEYNYVEEVEYEEEELEAIDDRLKNMGLMFAVVGVAVLAICIAVAIRKKLESRSETASKPTQEKS